MSNPLSGLKIDHWWQAFTVVGACGMVASLAFKDGVISQREAFLLFLSLFLFGVGQWINHPMRKTLIPGAILTGYDRHTSFLGTIFEWIGGGIFMLELWRILFAKSLLSKTALIVRVELLIS